MTCYGVPWYFALDLWPDSSPCRFEELEIRLYYIWLNIESISAPNIQLVIADVCVWAMRSLILLGATNGLCAPLLAPLNGSGAAPSTTTSIYPKTVQSGPWLDATTSRRKFDKFLYYWPRRDSICRLDTSLTSEQEFDKLLFRFLRTAVDGYNTVGWINDESMK